MDIGIRNVIKIFKNEIDFRSKQVGCPMDIGIKKAKSGFVQNNRMSNGHRTKKTNKKLNSIFIKQTRMSGRHHTKTSIKKCKKRKVIKQKYKQSILFN